MITKLLTQNRLRVAIFSCKFHIPTINSFTAIQPENLLFSLIEESLFKGTVMEIQKKMSVSFFACENNIFKILHCKFMSLVVIWL